MTPVITPEMKRLPDGIAQATAQVVPMRFVSVVDAEKFKIASEMGAKPCRQLYQRCQSSP